MVNVLLVLCALTAQGPVPRPRLAGGADRNDWQAFFDRGVEVLRRYPNHADSLFSWAHRLDPSRAEPLFARWVAFWMKDLNRFERYLDDDARELDAPEVLALDTLYLRALHRNPFVPHQLLVLLYDQLPGDWDQNPVTRGWLAYSKRQYTLAASYFRQLTRTNTDEYVWMHYARALTFVGMQAFDSANAEMVALLSSRRARADTLPSRSYESLEVINYGIALLHLAQGHPDSARQFFQHAVEENLAFFPAHVELGELALGRFSREIAERDFRQAAELAPNEAWIQHRYGVALLRLGRAVDALAPLERAIALEPWYAEPYLMLGRAWEAAGDKAAAAKAYAQYLERAPRRESQAIGDAQRRVAALRGNGP